MPERISNIEQGIKNAEVKKVQVNQTSVIRETSDETRATGHESRATNLEVSFDKAGVDFAFDEKVVLDNVEAGGDCCFDRLYDKFAQSSFHRGNGFGPRSLIDNKLANHRVITCRDRPALMDVGINSDTWAAGRDILGDFAGAGGEIVFVVLGIDSALDGNALMLDTFLANLDNMTCSDFQLPLD